MHAEGYRAIAHRVPCVDVKIIAPGEVGLGDKDAPGMGPSTERHPGKDRKDCKWRVVQWVWGKSNMYESFSF